MAFKTMHVGDSGVELAYSDSGPVVQSTSSSYTTIIAIHGMCFSLPIFQRLQTIAQKKGVRVIALNRRGYLGSTPFTAEELDVVKNGTQNQKEEWIKERGHEIAQFIEGVIAKNNLPPISSDGMSGGVVLVGWSLGAREAISAITHADSLPPATRSCVTSFIRSVVLYEPPRSIIGLPESLPESSPDSAKRQSLFDSNIPVESRVQAFAQWITTYFDHGDLSARDPTIFNKDIQSRSRTKSIYSMSKEEQEAIIYSGPEFDVTYLTSFNAQNLETSQKVLFDPATRVLFPCTKIFFLVGKNSPSYCITGLWDIQDEAARRGVNDINFKLVSGANHFVHWDYPELAVDLFLGLTDSTSHP